MNKKTTYQTITLNRSKKASMITPEDRPRDSIQKIAVLFTDIVGSSIYFKTNGDIAGRKMLKLHQDMTSPVIKEFGGLIVKMLGDSVMAYFLDPGEALKSAVKIQRVFQDYNRNRELNDQIHLRICIHFGDGIIEDRDIFGDVVNMAAKFLPIVESDNIYISGETYKEVKLLKSVLFQPVKVDNKKKVLKGLSLFKVVWEAAIDFQPVKNTLLLLRPAKKIGGKIFEELWQKMLKQNDKLWRNDYLIREFLLSEKSVALILKDIPSSMELAVNVLDYIRFNMGQKGLRPPVQIIIDSGPYLRAGRIAIDELKVDWKDIEPGAIYISASSHETVKDNPAYSFSQPGDEKQTPLFLKLNRPNHEQIFSGKFLYQNALIQGEHGDCFYCGSKKHATSDCPSKQLTELTHFADRIGYLNIDEINNLYFNYLNEAIHDNEDAFVSGSGPENNEKIQWAHQGFYELKNIFQLRMLMTVWNLTEENWNRIKENRGSQDKGGLLWIGLDCIRVSNFREAKNIISDMLSKNTGDYRVFCIAALLDIEKKNLQQAKIYIKKALQLKTTTPQKIYLFFLLSRIYYLDNDPIKARDMLRRIRNLTPYCYEALYQEILFQFRNGDKASAIKQLLKLIKMNRDYYVYAIIDPELVDYSHEIHLKLDKILSEAREKAFNILPLAKMELGNLEELMGKESPKVSEVASMLAKLEELSNKNSYFGYLDMIHYGESIKNMGSRIIESRKLQVARILGDLNQRINRCSAYLKALRYSFLKKSLSRRIEIVRKELDNSRDMISHSVPEEFEKYQVRLDHLSEELKSLESKLQNLSNLDDVIRFIINFFKKNILFQSANLIIGLILFPIMTHYLNFMLPGFKVSPQNIWHYQKIVIVLGAISGLILASLASKNNPSK